MLIRSYRVRGHLEARLDPLGLQIPRPHAELDPRSYGFTDADLDKPIFIDNVLGRETATLREIVSHPARDLLRLDRRRVHAHPGPRPEVLDPAQGGRRALAHRVRRRRRSARILQQLTEAEGFEAFCQKRYVTTKRFGLEGGEITIPALHAIIETVRRGRRAGDRHRHAASRPAEHAGQHREEAAAPRCSREFGGESFKPDDVQGSGDVKYHLGTSTDVEIAGHTRASVAAAQPVASGSGRSGGDRQGARAPGPGRRHAAPQLGDGDPDARRRGIRRPGPGVRDAGDEPAHRLPHRRHGAS